MQGTKPARQQWNQILDSVVTILKYKKITIYHVIYIKEFYGGILYDLTVSNDDVINTTTNQTVFPKLRRKYENYFEMKVQERCVLNYLIFRIFQSPLGFSIDHSDNTTEVVN